MRIYLAGPDVFLPDAAAIAAAKKEICARHGMTGVFPLDPVQDPAAEAAADRFMKIYLWNEAHIRSCDAMAANLTPFRGPSADAGTVFEIGFMRALGRPVMGYANAAASFRDRTLAFLGDAARRREEPDEWEDAEGLHLENFGLQDNLMIDGGILASGGHIVTRAVPEERRWSDLGAFEECIAALASARQN
ncbi:nucleoside 2-deoxyribosyltransferase [Pseudoroseomonas ludipueritiae]|uniref:Nucleoside 2-deoxyribosyltransferase n=1 Tax=Pseudoroseomonas ludipueritiae TaxID=198093 RepID=A0ABR7REC6_9PROT|nr:nucleoside 2-deoxyribosyltransferase [Pseudoroseomonas ludipueritiae]MBC9180014.1 nucleoside 2-deoxyribosyltransferase [Pseudoroseomonas ludipueritiae]